MCKFFIGKIQELKALDAFGFNKTMVFVPFLSPFFYSDLEIQLCCHIDCGI